MCQKRTALDFRALILPLDSFSILRRVVTDFGGGLVLAASLSTIFQ